jgi:TonB-linked SusC/RagA family outer membrane protein
MPMKKIYVHFQRIRLLALSRERSFVIIMLLIFSGLIPSQSSAETSGFLKRSDLQATTINGKITDETGAILPGVSIIEKGTTNGTVSDSEGKYRMTVSSPTAVLVFSFVGSVSQQVIVGSQTEINIKLESDVSLLSEVVVVGYGTQEKRDVTGAVASVKSEDFNKGIINSPEQLLQGKVAGVNITSASGEPGGTQSIVIRGPGGVRTGSTPLFVVDGMALDNSSTMNSPQGSAVVNPLNFINPQDIESIDVLKDASATAIYGARGANGVVLITTKRGKSGKSSINYSTSFGFSKMARPLKVFTADEYRQQVVAVGGTVEDSLANTNWQKQISRTALTQNHNLTLTGGADKISYYASLGMQDQEGVLKNSNMKRYSGRINVTQKLWEDRLSVDLNLNATSTINKRPPTETIIGAAITMNPTFQPYDATGKPYQYTNATNPLRALELNEDITTINRIIGNISPSLKIVKGLVYKLNFGIDNSNSTRDVVLLPSLAGPQQDGRLDTYYQHNNNNLVENYLTYTMDKGDHNFSVLAGHSYQKFFIEGKNFSINKFPITGIDPRYNPGYGTDLTLTNNKPGGFAQKNELQSFFGRLNYAYKDRYLFTATVRADGSSKFGANNKYGTFPSFSAGWRISDESFMQSIPVSYLKLRAGWGQTGNQEIPNKITQASFTTQIASTTTYPLNGSTYPSGTTFTRLANPNIKWEVSTQTNIGLDFGFLNGALTGSVDYFNKVSNDLLLEMPPSDPIQPAPTYWTNVSNMKVTNGGLELALNYQYKAANGFAFNIGGNTTFIHNRVTGSPYTVIPSGSATGSGLTSATINGYVNDQPIGTFYLRQFLGIDENGLSVYLDKDGDGTTTDADRISAGSALPKTMYNFNAGASFKGFDFTVNFNGVSGNKVYDNTANSNFYITKIFKGVNTTAEAVQYPGESTVNAAQVSTRYLKDGSFLRLNNASLGYSFSPSALGLEQWITGLRLTVTGQNLFVITKYNGYDPEVNIDRSINSAISYGIDYLSYPKARTYMVGLNVSF